MTTPTLQIKQDLGFGLMKPPELDANFGGDVGLGVVLHFCAFPEFVTDRS